MAEHVQRDEGELADDPVATVARLRTLVERTRPVSTADQRTLPVLPVLEDLLLGRSLRRGSIVQVDGAVGATSLALAVVAGPTRAGSWVACVGPDETGWSAAAEAGVDLERLVVVRTPDRSWATVTAALVDAFDVVLCSMQRTPSATEARRLHARARERGAVLVVIGGRAGEVGVQRRVWPDAPDVGLTVVGAEWTGLGQGWGNLRSRRITLEVAGRRGAGLPRRVDLFLPGPGGGPEAAPSREQAQLDAAEREHGASVTPLRRVG